MAHYFDTSALVKLVVAEPGSAELRAWLSESDVVAVSSDLARTELTRAIRRAAPRLAEQARQVLDSMILLRLTTGIFEMAGRLDPVTLRSLDALHLAAALRLEGDLEGVVTYDDRLGHAAEGAGVHVVSPGDPYSHAAKRGPTSRSTD